MLHHNRPWRNFLSNQKKYFFFFLLWHSRVGLPFSVTEDNVCPAFPWPSVCGFMLKFPSSSFKHWHSNKKRLKFLLFKSLGESLGACCWWDAGVQTGLCFWLCSGHLGSGTSVDLKPMDPQSGYPCFWLFAQLWFKPVRSWTREQAWSLVFPSLGCVSSPSWLQKCQCPLS